MSAIKEALALVNKFAPPSEDEHVNNISAVEAEIKRIDILIGELFGVEEEAKKVLAKHRIKLIEKCSDLKNELSVIQRLQKISAVYQRLSLEPLKWRDEQGFPKLAIFGLDSAEFLISVQHGPTVEMRPRLHSKMADMYNDVVKLLNKNVPSRKALQLRCQFTGMIPRSVRQKIADAENTFRAIYIIAEPKNFTLNEVEPVQPGDPLVVGYDSSTDPDHLWLIADFDTTPVEEAMIFHFNKNQTSE